MRLGLFGGSFDPIHLGHLLVAEEARDALRLDRVLFVPASRPPHKPGRALTPYTDRTRMVRLALRGNPGFELAELERDAARPSYTVETLRRLRAAPEPIDDLWLLLGGDSLEEIDTWREPEEIARLARLAVYPRPGWKAGFAAAASPVPSHAARWAEEGRLRFLDGPPIDLSATAIRERAAAGRSLRFLVPEPVRRFIVERGLYADRAAPPAGEREHE